MADKVAKNVLTHHAPNYINYTFLDRGSDERQFCSPHVDLPVCGICRSKYGEYPEYHTSADNMDLISPKGLQGSYELMCKIINALEYNYKYCIICNCEPQLGKRGLYPTLSEKNNYNSVLLLTNLIAYADGNFDLVDISNIIKEPIDAIIPYLNKLLKEKLIIKKP